MNLSGPFTSSASNFRYRDLNTFYYNGWQAADSSAEAADEIIRTPEKHLLSGEELFQAEGGAAGLAMQTAAVLTGVGVLFAVSPRMGGYWRTGSMSRMEWLDLTVTVLGANYVSTRLGTYMFGDQQKYNNHWAAYGLVKSQNRWLGRQILAKAPMMY